MKTELTLLFAALTFSVFGQIEKYECAIELTGVSEQWHKVVLPNSMFKDVSNNLSDIRIIGITAANDTIEAPYILRVSKAKNERKNCKLPQN